MNKAMLRSQSSSHNANTALKQINTRFEELERIHLTFLRKYQKDNSKILEHEHEISQELYDVILRNQNQIQSNLRQVTRLSESHKQDINNLTALLNQQEKEKSRSRDRSQGNDPLQSALEGNLDQLKKNINNALEIEQLERRTTIKIDLGFQQALQGIKSIVSKFPTSSSALSNSLEASSKTFSNSIKKSNILSISALQNSFEILKKELNLSVQEVDKWAISFNQESGFLHESFQQLKTHVASLINEVNNPSDIKSTSLTHSGSKEKNSGLARIRRNLPVIEDILTQCTTMDNRKNKIFKELRHQFDKRNNLALQCLEQVPEQLNALRLNQESISTEAFRSSESKRIPSPSPYTMTSGRSASTTKERPPSEGKRGSLPQKSALLSSAEKPKIPKVSSLLASRSMQSFDKSIFEQRKSLYDLTKDKQSRTLTFGRNESLQISQIGQSIGEAYENSQERERDLVSFSTLRTYIQNMITSADKLTKFLPRITSQELRALELYRNDKQVLENSLNRVNEKDIEMTPRDSIKPVSSRKFSPDVRASSVDAGKDRRNREQYKKLKEMESSKRQVVDEDLEEILETNQKKKIKDVKDSLKDSYKIYNDLVKGIEKEEQPQRDSVTKAQEKTKHKTRGESSGPIGRPAGESDKFKNSIVHLKSLKSDLDNLKVKYEALKSKQLVDRREERPSTTAVPIDRLERRERSIEADTKNVASEAMEKLRIENEKLEKIVARLRKKADDRKKTLRQLFELMTEKEKELNVYKWTMGAGNSEKHLNKVKEMIEAKRAELEVDFEKIKKKLGHREEELWKLEEKVSKLKKNVAMGNPKAAPMGGFEMQEDEREPVVIMDVPVKPTKKKSEGGGDSAKKNKEEGMRKDLRKHLMGSEEKKKKKPSAVAVTRGRDSAGAKEKKDVRIETEEAEIDLSPNKAKELKGIMQILKDEKEKLVDEMRNLEEAIMTQRINSDEQKVSERQPTSVESLKDEAEFKEAIFERDEIISQLNQENKALVERYNQIAEDMQLAQDHRKKMEKSYQDAINLLDEKVNGLNEYIEELETRNNARNKELTPEKRDRTPSPKRSITPLKQEYRHLKEVNSQLKDEREQILNKTQEIFSCLGIEGEEVKDLNACTKMDKVLQLLRTATIGETLESKESLELPKAKETESSWNQKEGGKNDLRRDFDEWRSEKSKGKGRLPSTVEDNADTFRVVTENKTEEFIERVYNALQKYGIIKTEVALEQKEKSDVDAFIKRIEENLMIYSKFQQDFVERYHEVEEEAKFMKQEVNKQEAKYQEKSKEIEKSRNEWKMKMEELQGLVKAKEAELKDVKEQLESIDADRKQKYSQIEGLRKSNEALAKEKEGLLNSRQEGVNMEEMEEALRILEEAKDKEIVNLQKIISQKDIDHKGLKDEIMRLKSIVEAHEQELEDVREVNAAKAQICESLQKELNALTTQAKLSQENVDVQVLTLQKELERVRTEKDQASNINHKLNTQISNLEGRLNDLSQNVKEKDSLISENNKQLKALKDSVTEREGRLEEIKARIIQCNTIYEEEKQAREKSDERIKELERELEESRENILEIEGQNKMKIDKLVKEKGVVEASLAEAKKEVQNVEKKEKELRGELKKSQEEKGKLEELLGEKEKIGERLTGEVNKLNAEIGENTEKNEKLKKELEETQRELNKLLGEKEAFQAERSLMDEKSSENVKSISAKISQYEENLQNANGKISSLQEEIETFKKEEQALRRQVEEKEKEVENLQGMQEEVKKLNKEKEANEVRFNQRVGELLAGWNEADEKGAQLTEQVRVLTENVDRLEQEKNEQATSIAKFENKVKAQEKELEDLRKTKEGLASDKDGAKQEIQGLQSKVDDLVDEKRKISEELNEVKLRNERLEESAKNLEENNKQDIESFQAKVDNLLNEKNLAESEFEQRGHKLEESINSLEENKRELQGKLDEALTERNKIADELNKVQLKNEKLEESIKNLEDFNKQNTANFQEEKERFASELAALQRKNEQDIAGFQAEKERLASELNQVQEQNQRLEESIKNLEGQNQKGIQGLQEEKGRFASELATLQEANKRSEESIRNLQEKNKQDIESFQAKLNGLQQENDRLVSELDNLNEMNHKLEESSRQLQQQKDKLTSELNNLKQVEKALKDKVELFEHEILATKAALQVSQEDHHKATEEYSIKFERLETEQNRLNTLVQEGEKEKSKAHTHIVHLETTQEALENNNKLLEKEKEELKKHLEEVKNAKDELVTRIDELEREKNMIRLNAQEDVGREKEDIRKYIEQLENEKEGLRANLKTTEKAQEESSQAIEELEHERNLLKGQIKGLDLEIEDAKKNNAHLEASLSEVEKAKEGLILRVEELERKNKETEEKLEGLAQERNVIQEKIEKEGEIEDQNMKKIEELQEVIESIKQEVEIKDEEIGRLNQELDELENEKITLNAQVEDLKDQLGLSENTRDLKAKIDELNEKLVTIEKERDEAKKQVQELEQEVSEIKSLLQKVESSRDSDFENIQKQEGGLEESTHEVKERLSLIEKERDEERKRIEALLAEKEKLELNIKKAEQEKIEAQRYVERLDDESEDLRRRNEELIKSLDIMSHEASQVKEASSRLSEYEQDAFKLGDKFEQTRYELETMKKEEKKYKEQLDGKVREIEELNRQLGDIRREKEQLKKDYEKRLAQIRGKKGGDQALYADYEEKINKLSQDNQTLTETNHSLQDQNEDIKRMMVILQEQIINMTEGRQQSLSTERTNNEIMEGLQKGLGQIANHHYLGDGIAIDFKFENRKQVDDCVNLILTKLNEKQYETPAFAAISEGGFEKERDSLHKEMGDLKSDFVKRLQRVVERIQRSLEEAVGDIPSSMRAEGEEAKTLEQMEKVIDNYLEGLRVAYLTNQSKAESGLNEVTTSERISKIVKENETLRGQNRSLQDELNHIKEELRFKEEEITDLSFKFKSDGENREGPDFKWNSMKDLDDQKIKSLLEDNDGKSVGVIKKSEGDSSDNASKNEMKQIYEKLRKLQDEYDKLDSEHKQLQADYDMVKFLNEDLKLELQDRDSNETERINQQLSVLKEEVARLTAENQQSDITHEKQHIRTMFDKFFKSALEGNKDALDLLKLLLSLLGYTEGGKNELLATYKAKATGKKSVFGKLF